jgi:ceramide glucosyltransferase
MHVAVEIVLGCAAIAGIYQVVQALAAWRFFRHARRAASRRRRAALPPVTVLKPLKGPGIELYENLASFCRQDYPAPVQVVFGVADPTDPAVAVVQRVKRDFPHLDVTLAIGEGQGSNRKVANLRQMMRHAKHRVLVMSDSDIRVRPDYLRTMVAPLDDPAVGLTTCLYRGRYFGLPSLVESLFINTDFIPMVLTVSLIPLRWGYGASIAFKREALDAIGGFGPIADHLADDHELGGRIFEAGWKLVLLPYVVETMLDSATFADVWRHQLRWARTYRVCQPAGWFASVVTHATLWGLVSLLALRGSPLGWAVFAAAITVRLGTLAFIMQLLRERDAPRHLWLVPLKDLASTAVWAMAFLGRRVEWSGQVLRVERDGRMAAVSPGVPVVDEPAQATASGR